MLPLCLLVLVTAQQVPPADELAEVTPPAPAQRSNPADGCFVFPCAAVAVSLEFSGIVSALCATSVGACLLVPPARRTADASGCGDAVPLLLALTAVGSLGVCSYALPIGVGFAVLAALMGSLAPLGGLCALSNKVATRLSPEAGARVRKGGIALAAMLAAVGVLVTVGYVVGVAVWAFAAMLLLVTAGLGAPYESNPGNNAFIAFAFTGGPVLTLAAWLALHGLGLLGTLLAWLSTRDATADLLSAILRTAHGPEP